MSASNIGRLLAAAADSVALTPTVNNATNAVQFGAGGLSTTGNLAVTGTSALTGNVTITGTLTTTGAITANGGISRSVTFEAGIRPKVGTTAGWVVAAGNNVGSLATMAQSQTAGTLVVYLTGLKVGDQITGFSISASINSSGGTVTLDANLRSYTPAAAATATDASIASITQISVTAATAVTASNLGAKTGLTTTVVSGTQYYLLLTGTTAASTTIELNSAELTVTTT